MFKSNWFPVMLFFMVAVAVFNSVLSNYRANKQKEKIFAAYQASEPVDTVWRGPNRYQIPSYNHNGKLIEYGYELIASTAYYLGPKGTVSHTTNGMNCQNCHLEGGTLPYGNNYGKVYSTYPQFRARNNGMQSIYARVNDCFERSLNGVAMDTNTQEMKAIYAYLQWLGNDIPKGVAKGGTSLMKLKYMDRSASPAEGRKVFIAQCQSCHGSKGEGQLNGNAAGYIYPPLWGAGSYNDGAGLYRLSSFAGFVKNNMPYGTDYHHTKLTNEEAWDVAAFVNSQPRPHKDQSKDWKQLAKKPVDFPFGPYADSFSEFQHKYGPFNPIQDFYKKNNTSK